MSLFLDQNYKQDPLSVVQLVLKVLQALLLVRHEKLEQLDYLEMSFEGKNCQIHFPWYLSVLLWIHFSAVIVRKQKYRIQSTYLYTRS